MEYSIGEFSKLSNLSIHTLRYYEKEQLIVVRRNTANRRCYTEEDINWIFFIRRLKETGMPIKDIKKYAILRYQGDSTMIQRMNMLEEHHVLVRKEKEKWESNLKNLDKKIAIYKQRIAEMKNI